MSELVEHNIKKLQDALIEEKDLDPISACLRLLACVIQQNAEIEDLKSRIRGLESNRE